jgi:hypothetical protein
MVIEAARLDPEGTGHYRNEVMRGRYEVMRGSSRLFPTIDRM